LQPLATIISPLQPHARLDQVTYLSIRAYLTVGLSALYLLHLLGAPYRLLGLLVGGIGCLSNFVRLIRLCATRCLI
jgi:hypothetical protein